MSGIKSLIGLQYELLDVVRSHILSLTGQDSEELVVYEHEFLKSLSGPFRPAGRRDFYQQLARSGVILMGDFHAFPANQECFLSVLEYMAGHRGGQKVSVALECLFEEDRESIEGFLRGRIDARQLGPAMNFNQHWGFPWGPIMEILQVARKYNLGVIPLNSRASVQRDPALRDLMFAEKLKRAKEAEPGGVIFGLVGEYHLSPGHLPGVLCSMLPGLKQGENLTVIFYSPDKPYFELLSRLRQAPGGLWQMKNGQFLICETPPWGKWFSWLLWQEHMIFSFDCHHCQEACAYRNCCFEYEELLRECWISLQKILKCSVITEELPAALTGFIHAGESGHLGQRSGVVPKIRPGYYPVDFSPSTKKIALSPLSWEGVVHGLTLALLHHFRPGSGPSTLEEGVAMINFIFNPLGAGPGWPSGSFLTKVRPTFGTRDGKRIRETLIRASCDNALEVVLLRHFWPEDMISEFQHAGEALSGQSSDTDASLSHPGRKAAR